MTERLRIGTRGSPLALAQTGLAVAALTRRHPGVRWEVVPVRTSGDRSRRATGTLDFTDEIDRRLESGEVDVAVHSTKDWPADPVRNVAIAAYLPRDDPRDALVLRPGLTFRSLPEGARLGSSSLRRRAQLLAARPDLEVIPIRGNVETRLDQIGVRGLDGVVLAAAGLRRLGLARRITELLEPPRWLPAPGQGAIAVAVRTDDPTTARRVRAVDHRPTRRAVEPERAVVRALGGDCDLPLGALGRVRSGRLTLDAALWSPDGRIRVSAHTSGPADRGGRLGNRLGARLARHQDVSTRSGGSAGARR